MFIWKSHLQKFEKKFAFTRSFCHFWHWQHGKNLLVFRTIISLKVHNLNFIKKQLMGTAVSKMLFVDNFLYNMEYWIICNVWSLFYSFFFFDCFLNNSSFKYDLARNGYQKALGQVIFLNHEKYSITEAVNKIYPWKLWQ